jgi:hypothetical protein
MAVQAPNDHIAALAIVASYDLHNVRVAVVTLQRGELAGT